MMDYVWEPAERSKERVQRRRSRWIAGAAAAVAAVIVAMATLTAPRGVIALNQGDFNASFVARQTLDENSTGRLIPADVLSGSLEGEGG
jgi:hypothetical protein